MSTYTFFATVEFYNDIAHSESREIQGTLSSLLETDSIVLLREGNCYRIGMDERNIRGADRKTRKFVSEEFVNPTLHKFDIGEGYPYDDVSSEKGDVYGFRVFVERIEKNDGDIKQYHVDDLRSLEKGKIYKIGVKAKSREEARKIIDMAINQLLINDVAYKATVKNCNIGEEVETERQ